MDQMTGWWLESGVGGGGWRSRWDVSMRYIQGASVTNWMWGRIEKASPEIRPVVSCQQQD